MAPLTNLSFETAGANPGDADAWTITDVGQVFEIEVFGPVPEHSIEGFESGWSSNEDYLLAYDVTAFTAAMFDALLETEPAEDFEDGWGTDDYVRVWSSANGEAAQFDTVPESHEDFEEGWDTCEGYVTDWSGAGGTAAAFDVAPENYEDFGEGWSNDTWAADWAGAGGTAAAFDGTAPENYEDFEELPVEQACTANAAIDVICCNGHGYNDGDPVMLRNVGGRLPGPLDADTVYFVVYQDVDSFNLALTEGGSYLNIVTVGTGTHYVRKLDETLYWMEIASAI